MSAKVSPVESQVGAFAVPTRCKCIAALDKQGKFVSHEITRRAMTEDDVVIEIKYAGICHSDIHQVYDEWGGSTFPMVPGHEISGVVVDAGVNAKARFPPGTFAGVGCMVDSCRQCPNCRKGEEQHCATGACFTYNSKYKYPHCAEYNAEGGAVTYGGYSKHIVVHKDFVVSIPSTLDLAAAAPLLCAGITTFSPLRRLGLKPTHRFGVIGMGGLGHMAVKFGKAFGAHTTVISRGTSKKEMSLNSLKADAFLDSSDANALKQAAGTFDFIINTISAPHDVNQFLDILGFEGIMVCVGISPEALAVNAGKLVFGRKVLTGSLIGGIAETQAMMDFCGRHGIVCDIEVISAADIEKAYARTLASDVKFRFVIDTATIA